MTTPTTPSAAVYEAPRQCPRARSPWIDSPAAAAQTLCNYFLDNALGLQPWRHMRRTLSGQFDDYLPVLRRWDRVEVSLRVVVKQVSGKVAA